MQNKVYFTVLALIAGLLFLLRIYFFPGPKFLFVAGAILVLYIWCKDAFTGVGWFEKRKPPASKQAVPAHNPFTETAVADPISVDEKKGYLQLMRELVTPTLHPPLTAFINNLKRFDDSNEEFEPLYSLSNFTDEKEIAFISLLDWKAAIEDLVWRIETSLKQNYDTVLDLPVADRWEPRASVSYDHVFTTYNDALKQHGFQLGFINTGSDDYALMVFKMKQQPGIEEAVKLTGYGYYELRGNPS